MQTVLDMGPIRTCVGCRARAGKSDLVRVVAVSGRCLPDPGCRQPGRGAYLHPTEKCFEQAIRRRALTRALRAGEGLDVSALRAWLGRWLGQDDQQGSA